jgi:hypothetical protein
MSSNAPAVTQELFYERLLASYVDTRRFVKRT